MGKNINKVLIILVIVLIMGVGGVFGYVYFCTDTFRSSQELFAKYLMQNIEEIGQTVNLGNGIENKFKQSKYEQNITMSYTEANESEPIEKITIDTQNDSINKKTYGIISVMEKGIEEQLEIEYMNQNDMCSVRFTNSVKQFLTVQNTNLKQLATKLGIDEETITKIPDKIDFQQFSLEELKLNDDEMNTEINKYTNLLYSSISENRYTKSKNVVITKNGKTITTNAYILTLNNQDIKNIVVKLLETLKQDEIVISKLQKLQSKRQLIDENIDVDINDLKENYEEAIQEIIDGLSEELIKENITITVYEEKGNTARVELKQGIDSITWDTTEIDGKNQIDINFTSIEGEKQQTSELIMQISENENNMKMDVTYVDKDKNIRLFAININFVEDINFEVVLNDSNNIILNQLTTEQITNIFNLLKTRLSTDYIEKWLKVRDLEANGEQSEDTENFTVTTDSENGIVLYEKIEDKKFEKSLKSDDIEFFTNISEDWLPKDINSEAEGSHNGEYYIAYTFYAENVGENTMKYWTTIEIDNVVRDMDEAIRIAVFKNGNKVVYAKNNNRTGQPEPDTVPFHDEDTVMLELTENFKVGDIDKYTVVIWVEGDDPDCIDDLIGGTVKMHMNLTEKSTV